MPTSTHRGHHNQTVQTATLGLVEKSSCSATKSEKQVYDVPEQDNLFPPDERLLRELPADAEKRIIKAYQRSTGKKQRDGDCLNDTGLRFTADIRWKSLNTYHQSCLARWACSYVVRKVERQVLPRKGTEKHETGRPKVTTKSRQFTYRPYQYRADGAASGHH